MKATFKCNNCHAYYPRDAYSKTQLKRKRKRKCKKCTMDILRGKKEFASQITNEPEKIETHIRIDGRMSEILSIYSTLSEQRSLLLVHSYIRKDESKYDFTMPIDLLNMLIRFLGGQDAWDKDYGCSPFIELPDNERSIIHKTTDGRFCTAFLSNIVSEGKHCWVFQITKMKLVDWSVIIGIYNVTQTDHLITQNYPFLTLKSGYCYFVKDARINDPDRPYSMRLSRAKNTHITDDGKSIITMIVDLDQKKINWKLNDEYQYDDCAFCNVVDGMYRAVVTLTQYDNNVQLISYQLTVELSSSLHHTMQLS
eukprot:1062894_1